ncbi:MAG TPA: DUF5103 domain-containing protein [Bacteroidetes bacterium]|nr:DUF5103 domain-containing protein [Bacteroidota bacterium]
MRIYQRNSSFFIIGFLAVLLMAGCPVTEGGVRQDSYRENEKVLRYEDHVYEEHIRTVQFYRGENPHSYPFLYLNDPTQLFLEFDALIPPNANPQDFWVSVVSCDHDWQPGTLLPLEFLEGIDTDQIYESVRSTNTLVPYVHYAYRFPSEGASFKRSGNYLLKVYASGNENDLILTRRFIVAEPKIEVISLLSQSLGAAARQKVQRLDFKINLKGSLPGMFDPRQDLKVCLLQNFRWDNALCDLQPLYMADNKLEYQIDAGTAFGGGNEYRWIDIRSTRFMPDMIRKIEIVDSVYHVDLWTDTSRTSSRYRRLSDRNGGYYIDVQEYPNPDWEADYVYVRFGMQALRPMKNIQLYVYGKFSEWQCTRENQLFYNPSRLRYEGEVLMKQGVYDYAYAVIPEQGGPPNESLLEGRHHETGNYYTILVYYKPMGSRAATLVGFKHINYIY